jgi:hypothetical protein
VHAWHALTSITEEDASKEQRREEKRRKQSLKLTQFQRTTYSQGREASTREVERGVCERTPWITRQRPNPIESQPKLETLTMQPSMADGRHHQLGQICYVPLYVRPLSPSFIITIPDRWWSVDESNS